MEIMDIDAELEAQAVRAGVSTAKLKCVYARGVRDCVASGAELPPMTAGIIRVERFIRAMEAGNPRLTDDADMLVSPARPMLDDAPALEVASDEAWDVIARVLYGDGDQLAALFSPGTVTDAIIEDDTALVVLGFLGADEWSYRLDLVTGEAAFSMP